MEFAKALYHRLIPPAIRNPFGLARRNAVDVARRLASPLPLPSRHLLGQIQLTPWVSEYLEIGQRSAASIEEALRSGGIGQGARVLDFGCGSGRTLRHLAKTGWKLFGCDVDGDAVAWTRRALPFATLEVNDPDPPLPWPDASFDAVFSVSVFTHFPRERQLEWSAELARVLRPGGLLAVSTMGRGVLPAFPAHATPQTFAILDAEGIVYRPGEATFNSNAAFHTLKGIEEVFGRWFRLRMTSERGLDGFQDLTLLERM